MGRAARQLNLSGVFAAAVTPNRPGTPDVDYSSLMDQLDFLAEAKVNGICLFGSTGEFLNYSFGDRQRAVYLGAKRSRVPLLVGVGHSTLSGCLQLASEAIGAGADGLLLMPPFFFRYGQREVEEFCLVVAKETGDAVPIVLYNIPQFTSSIDIETAKRLLDTGLFAGIKDSSGDAEYMKQLLAHKQGKAFRVFAGNDRIAACSLRSGADGVVSGCAAAIPELLVALVRAGGQNDAVNRNLEEFIGWIERFPAPVGVKRAVQLRGRKSGDFAIPFNEERSAELEQFSEWFRAWWPGVKASIQA
jgi:4-hydroxy-tetrahydrodipicolinate synthase